MYQSHMNIQETVNLEIKDIIYFEKLEKKFQILVYAVQLQFVKMLFIKICVVVVSKHVHRFSDTHLV